MTASRRILDSLERRVPALARAIATPGVRGATSTDEDTGTLWRGDSPSRALVVYLTEAPALSRWLAGSVALRLRALVLVPSTATDAAAVDRAVEATLARATASNDLPADPPVTIVAEGSAAAVAMTATSRRASRLALLYPSAVAGRRHAPPPDLRVDAASRVPTTLIQASADGPSRAEIVALERRLRAEGTAVRETEYSAVADGWARYPRASAGSRRALDDLIAFLDRGIGEASTFDVIPGWDLH